MKMEVIMPNTYLAIEDVLRKWKVEKDFKSIEYNKEVLKQHKMGNDVFELFWGYIAYKNNKGKV
jgi:hypothetical protein